MRGTTLANVTLQLKGELEASLVTGASANADSMLYTVVENTQKWLAGRFDWPFLEVESSQVVSAGTADAQRYLTLPTTINFERPVEVEILWNTKWHCADYGIGAQEYNTHPSGDTSETAEQADPVAKWHFKRGDSTKFEIWPLPATEQRIRFRGQAQVPALSTAGVFTTSTPLVLDDLTVVLFAAAKLLARRGRKDAPMVLAEAEARLSDVRAAYPAPSMGRLVLGGESLPESGYHKPRINPA